jgi:hypothetical protein
VADFVFNIAKGRAGQLMKNVDDGSPANSRLILIPYNATDTDDAIGDCDTVAAVEALSSTAEVSANGWNRKTLAAADVTITVDDTNNRIDVDIVNDQNWTPTASAVTDLLLAYDDDNTAGTDSNLVPLLWFDFAITPDGSQVTVQFNAAGVYRAS